MQLPEPSEGQARTLAGVVGLNGLMLTGVIVAYILRALDLTLPEDLKRLERVSSRRYSAPDS